MVPLRILVLAIIVPLATPALAAKALKVNKEKGLVTIDEGPETGFAKGAKVCFFDQADAKVECGVVKAAKGKKANIKVGKKAAGKIEVGFVAKIDSEGAEPVAKSGFLAVRGFYTPALMTPGVFNKISYLAPEAKSVDTLWSSTGTAGGAMLGFGGEVELLSMGVAVGFRYRQFTDGIDAIPIQLTNYDRDKTNLYVTNTLSGSAMGLWADYYLLSMFGLRIGAGADLDLETVDFKATKEDENGADTGELYALSSSLNVLSLRVPLRYQFSFGFLSFLEFIAGATFLLPLVSFGGPATVSLAEDKTNGTKVADNSADLITALGHTKGSIGLDLVFGMGTSF